jgi:hypothetical protein
MNPGLGTIRYPLSTRVYNITDDGTYGLSVTATPLIQVDWTMYDEFAASGLHHFGTPGVSGFRSSVGVFNHTKAVQRVQMTVYDAEGLEVWEREEELDMGQQVQYLLPQSLEAVGCSAVFINWGHETLGTGMIYPYITVTDNATGDGRFINASQYWGP